MLSPTIKESICWEIRFFFFEDIEHKRHVKIQKIQKMLDEEKNHREQVLEAKYRDMANLESKFTQLIEGEINVVWTKSWVFISN